MFVIGNRSDATMFWSTTGKWVDQDTATRFSRKQQKILGLPVNGYWVPLWSLDLTQFARLLAECEMAGIFTKENLEPVCESMDLSFDQVIGLIDRAQNRWEEEKERIR
jgi:hypothetical protein